MMPRQSLKEALTENTCRVLDGAMGTELMRAGVEAGACGEALNERQPEAVTAVHRTYREAGAELLLTNTFGASPTALERHGLADRCESINRAGAARAREAAGEDAWVLGNLGPTGAFLEPLGDLTEQAAREGFDRQAQALADGGVDGLMVETMADPAELALAVKAASATGLPVLASFAFDRGPAGFHTMMGADPAAALEAAFAAGADAAGANCGTGLGLEDYRELARTLVEVAGDRPIVMEANAGAPVQARGELTYPAGAEDFRALADDLFACGIRVLGGCCGTGPDHIRAIAGAARTHSGATP